MSEQIADLGIGFDSSELDVAQKKLDNLSSTMSKPLPSIPVPAGMKQTGDAADKSTTQVKNLGSASDELKKLLGKLGADTQGVTSKMLESAGASSKLADGLSTIATKAGSGTIAIVGITAAVVALVPIMSKLAESTFNFVDTLADSAAMYGYSASQILAMRTAAEATGGSLSGMMASIDRVGMAMDSAADGGKREIDALKQLGITTNNYYDAAIQAVTEYNKREAEGLATASDTVAMRTVLGRGWREQAQAILATASAMEISNQRAIEGHGISKASLLAADAYEQSQIKLTVVFGEIKSQIAGAVIPAFTSLTESMIQSYDSGGLLYGAVQLLRFGFDVLMVPVKAIISLFQILDAIVINVKEDVQTLWHALSAVMSLDFYGAWGVMREGSDKKVTGEQMMDQLGKTWSGSMFGVNNAGIVEPKKRNDIATGSGLGKAGGKSEIDRIAEELSKLRDSYKDAYKRNLASQEEDILVASLMQELEVQKKIADVLRSLKVPATSAEGKEVSRLVSETERLNSVTKVWLDLNQQRLDQQLASGTSRALGRAGGDESSASYIAEVAILKAKAEAAKSQLSADQTSSFIKAKEALAVDAALIAKTNEYYKALNSLRLELDASLNPMKAYADYLTKINDLQARGALTSSDAQAALMKKRMALGVGTFDDGITSGIDNYLSTIQDHAKLVEGYVSNVGKTLEDSLVGWMKTGKMDWQSLLSSLLSGFAQLFVQLTIMEPLMKSMKELMGGSSGGGGFGSLISSLFGGGGNYAPVVEGAFSMFANGGVLGRPSYAANGAVLNGPTYFPAFNTIGGEAGPEVLMPAGKMSNGQFGVQVGGLGGSTTNAQFNINVTVQGGGNSEETATKTAVEVRKQVESLVDMKLKKAIEPGGQLNKMNTWGVRR